MSTFHQARRPSDHLRTSHAAESLHNPFISLHCVHTVNLCATVRGSLTCGAASSKCHNVEESVLTYKCRCFPTSYFPGNHLSCHCYVQSQLFLVQPAHVLHGGPRPQRRSPYLHCASNCSMHLHSGRTLVHLATKHADNLAKCLPGRFFVMQVS